METALGFGAWPRAAFATKIAAMWRTGCTPAHEFAATHAIRRQFNSYLRWRSHPRGSDADARSKVPSTISTKFLSSRRIKRLLYAVMRFPRASGSALRRVR